jgi:thioredoxin 1
VFLHVAILLITPIAKPLQLLAQDAKLPLTLRDSYRVTKRSLEFAIHKRGEEMATEKVTAANFADVVLKSSTPVLVDFWAEWCGPCRAVGPILEEISNEHGSKIKIVKLNTDEEGSIAMKYGINSIPTMNVFVGGQVVKSIVGARPKPALLKELSEYIN